MKETEAYRPGADLPGEDPRLLAVVRAYQAALEAGERPNRADYLARHPDLADELADCLDGLEFLHSTAARLRPAPAPVEVPRPDDGTLGDFRLLGEIGRGGMGVVYEAEQISLRRRVALKVLPLAATLDIRQLQRFENEARAAALLHHPHIVPVFAVGCERGVHYYAMQLIAGRTLAAVIDDLKQTPLPALPVAETVPEATAWTHQSVTGRAFFRHVARLGKQAAEALEYAHQMGVVHRDIKPANLLLDPQGSLWVTDFGLARFQASPVLTSPGDLVGTLRYMSPEQAAGQPVIDPRSDVYSLGATLYELLTQQPAFDATSRAECLRQILEDDPTPPRRLNRAVPAELEIVVLKAMAKVPEDRYASAKELADDLERYLDDRPVQARRPGLQAQLFKWIARHRRMVAVGVLGLVAAVLVLAVTTYQVALAEGKARQAHDDLKEQEGKTAKALEQEVVQRRRAEANYRQARKVLDYLTRLGVEEMANRPEMLTLRRRLLAELLAYYEELIDQADAAAKDAGELIETRLQVAELLDEVGRKAESLAAFEQAMRDRARLPGGPRPWMAPFGPPRGLARVLLLAQPDVRADLKLSETQAKQAETLLDFGGKPPTGEALTRAETVLDRMLLPTQAERLQQILRQSRGAHALLDPETAQALALTGRQKETLFDALPRRGPWHGRRDGPGRGPRPPEDQGKQGYEAMLRLLTPAQRAKWQAMLGEPFRGDLQLPPPFPPPPPPDGEPGGGPGGGPKGGPGGGRFGGPDGGPRHPF